MADLISGNVVSVRLNRDDRYGLSRYGTYREPIKAEIELDTDNGRMYISTQVGEHVVGLDRPVDCEYASPTQKKSGWPIVLESSAEVIRSRTPEVFPNAACLASRLILTIWQGDKVTVTGSVKGRRIIRASILGLERDGQTWKF